MSQVLKLGLLLGFGMGVATGAHLVLSNGGARVMYHAFLMIRTV